MTQHSVELPLPPSANNIFINAAKGGRVKSPGYRAWLQEAGLRLNLAKWRVPGPVSITICLPEKMRGDVDNRAKPLLDALVAHKRIDDDRNVQELHVRKTWADPATCKISVQAVAGSG